MTKIAIITYDMIPDSASWGGCQRMYYLAEHLINSGIDTTVFSVKKGYQQTFGNSIHFHGVMMDNHNKIYRNYIYSKKKLISPKDQDNFGNTITILRKVREWGKNTVWAYKFVTYIDKTLNNEPSTFTGFFSREWCRANASNICKYLQENRINVIIISAPPFGMFSIAKLIKRHLPNIKILFDYRDPWNLWKDNNKWTQVLEAKYLKYADKIVCTNENLTHDMSNKYNIQANKFLVIPNGYSEATWAELTSPISKSGNRMIVTYAGSISVMATSDQTYRDTSQLFNALEELINEQVKITIRLVGVSDFQNEYIFKLQEKFKEAIELIPVVNTVQANKYMLDSDVLLLLHTTNDMSARYIISGKIYDYIRAGKPIFSIGDFSGLHAELIKRYNLGINSKNDSSDIHNKLLKLYQKWENGNLKPTKVNIFEFSREYQNEKYLKIIEQVNQ